MAAPWQCGTGWSRLREIYNAIVIDCGPTLSMLTVNALNAADQLLVPVQTETLAGLGVSLLLETANKLRRRSNPNLKSLAYCRPCILRAMPQKS